MMNQFSDLRRYKKFLFMIYLILAMILFPIKFYQEKYNAVKDE